MGHYQPPRGPLPMHYRRNARFTDEPNLDTTRHSFDPQEDLDVGDESEQAQAADQKWTADAEPTDSTAGETGCKSTLNRGKLENVANRTRAQTAALQSALHEPSKRSMNATEPPQELQYQLHRYLVVRQRRHFVRVGGFPKGRNFVRFRERRRPTRNPVLLRENSIVKSWNLKRTEGKGASQLLKK